jgi:hypothetical protein
MPAKPPKLGKPHPYVPGLYYILPDTPAEQLWPYLRDRRTTPAPKVEGNVFLGTFTFIR